MSYDRINKDAEVTFLGDVHACPGIPPYQIQFIKIPFLICDWYIAPFSWECSQPLKFCPWCGERLPRVDVRETYTEDPDTKEQV